MTTKNPTLCWIKLEPVPRRNFDKPFPLNSNEFIVTTNTELEMNDDDDNYDDDNDNYDDDNYMKCCIAKYNITKNQWEPYMNNNNITIAAIKKSKIQLPFIRNEWFLPTIDVNFDEYSVHDHSSFLDKETNIIYICTDGALLKIDLNTKKGEHNITDKGMVIGDNPSSIVINNKYHVIGGSKNNKHLIWYDENKKFEKIYQFDEFSCGTSEHGLVHLKSKNKLLLFGGYNWGQWTAMNDIYSYDIDKCEWNKLNEQLPMKLYSFGYVLTNNEQYLIIFGGNGELDESRDDIFILNLDTMKFKKHSIKCPSQGLFHIFLTNDEHNADVICRGYIRLLSTMQYFPNELIQIIKIYFYGEYIHLLQREVGDHWKIRLNDILLLN